MGILASILPVRTIGLKNVRWRWRGVLWAEAWRGGVCWLELSSTEAGGGAGYNLLRGAAIAEVAVSDLEPTGVSANCCCRLWSAVLGYLSWAVCWESAGVAAMQAFADLLRGCGARGNKLEFAGNFERGLLVDEVCRAELREITSSDGVANWDSFVKAARRADLRR